MEETIVSATAANTLDQSRAGSEVVAAESVHEVVVPVAMTIDRRDLAVWAAVCALSAVFISAIKVPTFLGVSSLPWLHVGEDYPWRVWWRARDLYVHANNHALLYVVLGGALAVVFVSTALACLLLLSRPVTTTDPTSGTEI